MTTKSRPPVPGYLNFDLLLDQEGESFVAWVLDSPAGQAKARFNVLFQPLELENLITRIGVSRRDRRTLDIGPLLAAKALGSRIFEAAFAGRVGECLQISLALAESQQARLRIRLRLGVQNLSGIPWEYLYDSASKHFVVLSERTSLVRYLSLSLPVRPLRVSPPVRVLGLIASPFNAAHLKGEVEWGDLTKAFQPLKSAGQVNWDRLEKPTLAGLRDKLSHGQYHVLHFVGHGVFDHRTQDGVLLLEDDHGRGVAVSAERLATILHNHPSLRLVVLNCCDGGQTSVSEPFSGIAQSLIQQGVPAVVAMQFEITDDAAVIFAREFYQCLGSALPVDAALMEARVAMYAQREGVEFGAPVLYMRSPDGILFDLDQPKGEPRLAQPSMDRKLIVRSAFTVFMVALLVAVYVVASYFIGRASRASAGKNSYPDDSESRPHQVAAAFTPGSPSKIAGTTPESKKPLVKSAKKPDRYLQASDIVEMLGGPLRGEFPKVGVQSPGGEAFPPGRGVDIAPGNGDTSYVVAIPLGAKHFIAKALWNQLEPCTGMRDSDLNGTILQIRSGGEVLFSASIQLRDPKLYPIYIDLVKKPHSNAKTISIVTTPAGPSRACCQVALGDAHFTF
jgi:hypothetical protein